MNLFIDLIERFPRKKTFWLEVVLYSVVRYL